MDAGTLSSGGTDAGTALEVDAGQPPVFDAGQPPVFDAGQPTMPDAGQPAMPDAGSDLGDAVPNSAPACTSGVYWLLGDLGTDLMHPGRACIQCHSQGRGPSFSLAGTVYPTTHEPDDCDGVTSGWTVIITDAAGNQVTMTPNLAGNFHSSTAIQYPYTAKVVAHGQTREMLTPQTTGDCNSCHTQDGTNGAPGRIVSP